MTKLPSPHTIKVFFTPIRLGLSLCKRTYTRPCKLYLFTNTSFLHIKPWRFLQEMTLTRDEDPTFFSTDPDPAQLEKYFGSGSDCGSDLKSK